MRIKKEKVSIMKKSSPFNPNSVQKISGFDLNLKMSMNYLSRYFKGWRELDFISNGYPLLKEYVESTNFYELHHIYENNDFVLVKMYPIKTLLMQFKKTKAVNIEEESIKIFYINAVDKYLKKINNQNKELKTRLAELSKKEINELVLRIPHNSPSLKSFEKFSNSLCLSKKEFIDLSNYNSDPLLNYLINGKRFSYMAIADTSRLFVDLERLPGNDSLEDTQGFSFMPKFAISPHDDSIVKIRNYDYSFQDPNYFTFLTLWTNFNSTFESKVLEISSKENCRRVFVISLHSFNESYISKKFPKAKRKCPDINIILSEKINPRLQEKIKRKIYNLDHKFKIRTSFSFPYHGTYELLNTSISNAFCLTIEINKKIYLEDIYSPKIIANLPFLKKFLDEFFIYLQRLK